jgi:hypothetical protein
MKESKKPKEGKKYQTQGGGGVLKQVDPMENQAGSPEKHRTREGNPKVQLPAEIKGGCEKAGPEGTHQ